MPRAAPLPPPRPWCERCGVHRTEFHPNRPPWCPVCLDEFWPDDAA